MKFNFENLNEETRRVMLEEVNSDSENSRVYHSKRFNDTGNKLYLPLLKEAVTNGDEATLGQELKSKKCFKAKEERNTKSGVTLVNVPETAHLTLAESEFNRYYMRGLCVLAIRYNKQIQVYRGRHSENPRTESELLVGKVIDPHKLLEDLRKNIGVDTALGLPPGPNSGLTVRLV